MGVNVFRVNFSHADYADVKEKWKSLEILMMSRIQLQQYLGDLQGPKLHVGVMRMSDSTWRWFNYVSQPEDILGTAQKCSWNIKTFQWCVNTCRNFIDDGKLILNCWNR
jgi:pyruvate kinase